MRNLACITAILGVVLSCPLVVLAGPNPQRNFDVAIDVTDYDCGSTGCFFARWLTTRWIEGGAGGPYSVDAHADFSPVGEPWNYSYSSANPVSWFAGPRRFGIDNPCTYASRYGIGGSISVLGPDGLIFTGIITGGGYSADIGRNASFGFQGSEAGDHDLLRSVERRYLR